jgi:hypothetical protein
MNLIDKLKEMGVTVLLGPAHASHMWQMTDSGPGNSVKRGPPLKPGFKIRGGGKGVKRAAVVHWRDVIKQRRSGVWASMDADRLVRGWARSGLVPFNPRMFNDRGLAPPRVAALLETVCLAWGGEDRATGDTVRAVAAAERALVEYGGPLRGEELITAVKRRSLGGTLLTDSEYLAVYRQMVPGGRRAVWVEPREATRAPQGRAQRTHSHRVTVSMNTPPPSQTDSSTCAGDTEDDSESIGSYGSAGHPRKVTLTIQGPRSPTPITPHHRRTWTQKCKTCGKPRKGHVCQGPQ